MSHINQPVNPYQGIDGSADKIADWNVVYQRGNALRQGIMKRSSVIKWIYRVNL